MAQHKEGKTMKAGLKDFCGLFSTAFSILAALSCMAAVTGGSRNMYIQAIVYGLMGAGVALAALLRM